MVEKVKELMIKYREIIVYLIVGVLTTIVSWAAGVLFAYPLNRKWVFQSKNKEIMKEFFGFASSRISTLILDIVIMWLTVNVIGMNYWIAKIFISAVLVTIANYVFSKLLIFKKKDTE